MLVLNRNRGQQIIIDGEITVTVAEIRGERVKLVVGAPKEVRVRRGELVAAIERTKRGE